MGSQFLRSHHIILTEDHSFRGELMMRNCVRKATPLALALVLAYAGNAFAGANENVVLSLNGDTEISGVGPGQAVTVELFAAGMAGVAQYDWSIEVDPADAFDLDDVTFSGVTSFIGSETLGVAVNFGVQVQVAGAQLGGTPVTEDGTLGTITLNTAAGFTTETTATIRVVNVSIGPSVADRDVFSPDATGLDLQITLNPPPPPTPPPVVTSIDPTEGFVSGGTAVTITGTDFQDGATVNFGATAATNVVFNSATSLTATAPAAAAGAVSVSVTNPDAQTGTLDNAFTYNEIPPVIEPTLTAASAVDRSLDFSPLGTGNAADGSIGEATFSVRFTDNTSSAAAGQEITWTITNEGTETAFLVDPEVLAIEGGSTQVVTANTGAGGVGSAIFDAEGDRSASGTSISVIAATSADNSDGDTRNFSITFSAQWDVPVAAELASFAGSISADDEVVLEWSAASQTNNLGWEIYRSLDNFIFERVGDLVPGDGTTDEFISYSFFDQDLPATDMLYYYLRQVDLDGTATRSSTVEILLTPTNIAQQILPTANFLRQNFPNPFNPETTLSFDLKDDSVVTLKIYDMTGQVVRTLVNGQSFVAGAYQILWDAKNNNGQKVGSGVYLYQLKTREFTSLKKMTLVR
jgi:hypothetical protein